MVTLVLGTAGHIDHGKSRLVEALTGTHPDRLAAEQARGITIELGFAHVQIGDVAVALVDVPGHERFVRTMLAGAGGLDAVLLVVAANESVMPQTREHVAICRLLGVDRGLVVLTKADLVDAAQLARVEADISALLAGTALASAPVLAVSATTGLGLDALREAIVRLARERRHHGTTGVCRVPIDRVFSMKGFGTVVTGTLLSGRIAVDDALELMPGGRPVRVRGLQVHGTSVAAATAPRRVAVNLGGVPREAAARGMTLAAPGGVPVTRRLDVRLDLLPGSPPVRQGARVRVHQGTAEVAARVSIAAVRASADDAWVPVVPGEAAIVPGGGQAYARLHCQSPLVVTRGDRFVCRWPAPAGTIGGGVVLDPEAPRTGVRRAGTVTKFLEMDTGSRDRVVAMWLNDAGLAGLTATDVARRAALTPPMAESLAGGLVDDGRAVRCADRVVADRALATAAAGLTAWLDAYHRAHPAEAGAPRDAARTQVARTADAAVFDAIVTRAGAVGGDRLALPGHRPSVSSADAEGRTQVLRVLREAGLQPPIVSVLAVELGRDAATVTRWLTALGRERALVRVSDLWFHPEALEGLKAGVRALGSGAVMEIADAKATFGVSRKFAIPLLEYLDRERVTRRVGDKRLVI